MSAVVVWAGALSGCSSVPTKPADVSPTGEETVEECRRRTRAAAQQEDSMRRVDQPGKFNGWNDEPRVGDTKADPCVTDPGPGGLGTKGATPDERKRRAFAKTRARVMVQSKEPEQARDALIGAFSTPAEPDAEVYPLATQVSGAYQKVRVAEFKQSGKIGVLADGKPTCAFARFAIVDRGESSMNQVRYQFERDAKVHALCRLPDRGTKGEGTVRLSVWHKTRPGARKLVKVVDAGSLKDARDRGGYVSAPLELELGERTTKGGPERVYFIVTLSVERPNVETASSTVSDGFFWFMWPKK